MTPPGGALPRLRSRMAVPDGLSSWLARLLQRASQPSAQHDLLPATSRIPYLETSRNDPIPT